MKCDDIWFSDFSAVLGRKVEMDHVNIIGNLIGDFPAIVDGNYVGKIAFRTFSDQISNLVPQLCQFFSQIPDDPFGPSIKFYRDDRVVYD
jgi:hypothetical protein